MRAERCVIEIMAKHSGTSGRKRPELKLDMASSAAEAVESKPHAMYIKYLMTKRCGVLFIVNELHKLGLSAPQRSTLVEYYNEVIDPLVKKNRLTGVYNSYKQKLNGKETKKSGGKINYTAQILNFKTEIGEASSITQANFCKFLKDLGVEKPWLWELTRFYRTADNFPTDANGVRILSTTYNKTTADKVVSSKYRYIIERLIIENLSCQRIAQYCQTALDEHISAMDIGYYKEVFFNTKLNSIDQNLELLEGEKAAQQSLLSDIQRGAEPYRKISAGEKTALTHQVNRRINEIDENIRTLRAAHTSLSFNTGLIDKNNFKAMFEDVVKRSYMKFCNYDGSNDRDIANPMKAISSVMFAAYDKIEKIMEESEKQSSDDDGGIRYGVASLMQQRLDEIEDQEKERANAAL